MEKALKTIGKFNKTKIKTRIVPRRRLPVSLRRPVDERRYRAARSTRTTDPMLLSEPRIMEWNYWALIDNAYPYSGAFKVHHMLIPKREVSREEITAEEWQELEMIITELGDIYDCRMVNYANKQSIKSHFHMHFLVYYDSRKHMKV